MAHLPGLGRVLADLRKLCGLSVQAPELLASSARAYAQAALLAVIDQAVPQIRAAIGARDYQKALELLSLRSSQMAEAELLGELAIALCEPGSVETGSMETGSIDLPGFLVRGLEEPDLAPALREVLIYALEETQVFDPVSDPVSDPRLRTRARAALRAHALELKQDPSCAEPLWSALRRYCAMLPRAEVGDLIDFLGPDEAPTTLQVVAQGLVSMFSQAPPEVSPALERVRDQVVALAQQRLTPAGVASAADAALLSCLLQAAIALADPRSSQLMEGIEVLGHKALTERVRRFAAEFRPRRGAPLP